MFESVEPKPRNALSKRPSAAFGMLLLGLLGVSSTATHLINPSDDPFEKIGVPAQLLRFSDSLIGVDVISLPPPRYHRRARPGYPDPTAYYESTGLTESEKLSQRMANLNDDLTYDAKILVLLFDVAIVVLALFASRRSKASYVLAMALVGVGYAASIFSSFRDGYFFMMVIAVGVRICVFRGLFIWGSEERQWGVSGWIVKPPQGEQSPLANSAASG